MGDINVNNQGSIGAPNLGPVSDQPDEGGGTNGSVTTKGKAGIQDMVESWESSTPVTSEQQLKFVQKWSNQVYEALTSMPELPPAEEATVADVQTALQKLSMLNSFFKVAAKLGTLYAGQSNVSVEGSVSAGTTGGVFGTGKTGASRPNAFLAGSAIVAIATAMQEMAKMLSNAAVQEGNDWLKWRDASNEQVQQEAQQTIQEGQQKKDMYDKMANIKLISGITSGALAMVPVGLGVGKGLGVRKLQGVNVTAVGKQFQMFQGFVKDIADYQTYTVQGAGELGIANTEAQKILTKDRYEAFRDLYGKLANYVNGNHDTLAKALEAMTQMISTTMRAFRIGHGAA